MGERIYDTGLNVALLACSSLFIVRSRVLLLCAYASSVLCWRLGNLKTLFAASLMVFLWLSATLEPLSVPCLISPSVLFAMLTLVDAQSQRTGLAVTSLLLLLVMVVIPPAGRPDFSGRVLYGHDWDGDCLDVSYKRVFSGGPCFSCPRVSSTVDCGNSTIVTQQNMYYIAQSGQVCNGFDFNADLAACACSSGTGICET